MDTTSRRPQLPALSYLEVGNIKKDEELYQSRNTATPNHKSVPLASPTHQYPTAPPPPYTHPSHHHGNTWAKTPVHTPPEPRRLSGDDNEGLKQNLRQSLPSISEALGSGPLDNHASHPPPTSTTQAPPPSSATSLPTPQSGAPRSPSSAARRPYAMEPPPQSQNHSQYSYFRQDSAGPQHSSAEVSHPSYGQPQENRPPPPPAQTPQPPRASQPPSHPLQQPASPRFEPQHSHPPGSMPPPPSSTFQYGYQSYTPRYAQPPSNGNSGPVFQPSAHYAAPSTPQPSWKSEPSRYPEERPADRYGDSVKRHLDMYDVEASLSEIGQTSNHMMDFSRRYGDRMHQNARAGPSLATLPSVVEVEDMIQKARIQLDSLSKIREVVLTQQAAYEQQMADQRQRHESFTEAPPPPPSADPYMDAEDVKGGFAGSETKKRRGRAAPPGRCHSCNRAETPEWRRGPDGARTLCNACGLHYAKLTRKQTTAGKNGNVGSSNLRPKEA
ncbi:uncharacterized protein LTR77_005073 [Saxophila tyrrhenica]|uniref:GATA-type domain-containing protein n=1 Tax=Saxophila tyrrhenica TaxID=1690608 RepID=A0AAV9PBN5_9PEZI|nr:hypothetical protein LTR77_005073 [Saxophila tyrrhenica]